MSSTLFRSLSLMNCLISARVTSFFFSICIPAFPFYFIFGKSRSTIYFTHSGFLPTFFLSPFAGVWADRYNRKVLIVLADSSIALATLVLALLFLAGYKMLWLLFFMSAIRALGAAIQIPAVGALLPQIVPGNKLTRVNAINSSIQSLVSLASPMLSGALLTFSTIEIIFFIDVVTAAIGITTLLFFLHVPVHDKAREKQTISYFSDMSLGFAYIKNHAYLKNFFAFCAVFLILAAPASFLTPLQVARSYGSEVWRLTAIEVAFSSGMICGGIIMASWGGFKNRIHSMTLACLVFGICTFALGVMPVFWLYLVIMVIVGVAMPFFNVPATVLLQEKVEADYLGRIFGIMGMLASAMMPMGMLVFGPLADIVRVEWLLLGTGVVLFIQGFFLPGNKVLLEAGKPGFNPE
ncbi:MAG: MFS transporter [Pelotomaculum sp.]